MPLALQRVMLQVNMVGQITLLLTLAALMLKKRLNRDTPVFFFYVVFDACGMAFLFTVQHLGFAYTTWYGSWVESMGCIVLGFAVISEIFDKIFASYSGIRRLAKDVVWGSAIILLALAAISVTLFHQVNYTTPVVTALLMLQRSLRFVQLGLILSLFAVSKYLHLRWRNFMFGIALGFGLHALMVLTGNIVRAYYGQMLAGAVGVLWASEYCVAVVLWIGYALQPDLAVASVISLPSHELEKWDLALSRLLGHTTSSSIPAPGE